ncbi:MAG TPA: nicotinamide-nucleotide amidohydrolase family protein [Planctomycetota bacterium]|nr:nicotinamide-nucleotide amidohydrolase family protein [Planctomycetota bacterium]
MPNAILCMTGSELTRGETRDSNGPYLAMHLSEMGVPVDEIRLVPDDPRILEHMTRTAIEAADVVILSGGLGPTADDHTVSVLAAVFGQAVVRDGEAATRMLRRAAARGWKEADLPKNYLKQAEVLAGAKVLLNPVGLAPGMILDTARGIVVVLPGVPRELEAMFQELVAPAIRQRFHLEKPRIFRAKVLGQGESWVEARIQKLGVDFRRVEYGISAKPGEILVKFVAHRPEDHAYLDEVSRRLVEEFRDEICVLPEGLTDASGTAHAIEHSRIVHDLLVGSGLRLATAESCTGGAIAKCLTDHPGSSAYLAGAIVAYSNDVKQSMLLVPAEMLERHGAVSAEVCEAMAVGAIERLGVDIALAVTGIAGPDGGTAEKPVGLVYLALAARGVAESRPAVQVERQRFVGQRDMVRRAATIRALEILRRWLVGRARELSR